MSTRGGPPRALSTAPRRPEQVERGDHGLDERLPVLVADPLDAGASDTREEKVRPDPVHERPGLARQHVVRELVQGGAVDPARERAQRPQKTRPLAVDREGLGVELEKRGPPLALDVVAALVRARE